jgi:serine/threonine protein kinase
MLSGGHFPYGKLEEARPHKHYDYISVRKYNDDVPIWMDRAIQKAVSKNPERRYDSFSEFERDLSNPNPAFMKSAAPLLERNPMGFWKGLAVISMVLNLILLVLLSK